MIARVAGLPSIWKRTPSPDCRRSALTGSAFFFEERDRSAGHDGRDGMLVDKLGKTIATQEDAKIIEPRDDPLEFDPVDEENRHGDLLLAHVVEKGVLEVLGFVLCHLSLILLFFGNSWWTH